MKLAYLTPYTAQFSEPNVNTTINVPGSLLYLVSGALRMLAESHNWEQYGTATPEETADFFEQKWYDWTQSIV